MTPLLQTPRNLTLLKPTRGMRRGEAEIIAGRIASARHWQTRRRWLRLRVALFGRRKAHAAARSAAPRPPQAVCLGARMTTRSVIEPATSA